MGQSNLSIRNQLARHREWKTWPQTFKVKMSSATSSSAAGSSSPASPDMQDSFRRTLRRFLRRVRSVAVASSSRAPRMLRPLTSAGSGIRGPMQIGLLDAVSHDIPFCQMGRRRFATCACVCGLTSSSRHHDMQHGLSGCGVAPRDLRLCRQTHSQAPDPAPAVLAWQSALQAGSWTS